MKDIILKLIDQAPAIVTALGVIVAAYLSYKANQQGKQNATKIEEVHDSVNGKMEKLLEVTKAASRAEGLREGELLPQRVATDEVVKVELVEAKEQ